VWKLSKLEIRGFKSFADAAELDFPEGITAVVGPNGCGKSNISDAILWVLGEQSTRALRAHRMQDVIFQGTATRRAIGLAEVTLYLTNESLIDPTYDPLAELEAGGLARLAGGNGNGNGNGPPESTVDAVDAGEGIAIRTADDVEIETLDDETVEDAEPGVLKITRRLFRSGDSEYLLNGKKCRLRDIRERLAGTGLGSRACFLIGQGKIDQILSASSVDRRAPLEEAAGITLYRQRRHLTQLKLEATAQDLARIDDIYQEVGRQMRSLKRQAGRARRYKKLREQLRRLERAWLHGELSEARRRVAVSAAAVAGARDAEETARAELQTAAGRLATARERLRASRLAEQERRQGLYQNQLEQERLKSEAQRQDDRAAFAGERLAELERRAAEMEERLAEAAGLREQRQEVLRESELAAAAARSALEEAEEELEGARDRLQLAMRPAATLPEDGRPRPLSTDLVVEAADFPPLSLALGDLLDAKVLPETGLQPWLQDSLDGNRRVRGLRATEQVGADAPPADERIVGALRDRVSGRSASATAVIGAVLRDTWLVAAATDAPALAREHPGHAFVDVTGSCWARDIEVRVRGRQARTMEMQEPPAEAATPAADRAPAPAGARGEPLAVAGAARSPVADDAPQVTSPEELAAREARNRAAGAARAAEAQASAARQELAVAEAAGRRLTGERERALAEIKSLRVAVEEAGKRAAEARAQVEQVAAAGAELAAQLDVAGSDDRAGEAEVAGLEAAQAQSREALETAQEKRSRFEIEAAEARVAGQHTEQQVRDRLSIEPERLLAEGPVQPEEHEDDTPKKDDVIDLEALDARQLRAQILDVQARIERLGPVNLMAYEDFEVQEARHAELGTQRRDLKNAAANLDEAIRRIDEDCIQRFNDCFESINGYFNRIFRQLFGGGKAGMRLEEPDDPLNTGIEIFAQPPGKRLQNIRLLSGGERTLVALSLLFSIFEYRPAAFCILDEADAALDEPNVDRFLRALHSFENRTQFILITHNKRTMEIADLLYGVTMQESGVSQLVSVQLH
jgi:chromosome segregation protein